MKLNFYTIGKTKILLIVNHDIVGKLPEFYVYEDEKCPHCFQRILKKAHIYRIGEWNGSISDYILADSNKFVDWFKRTFGKRYLGQIDD